MLSEMDQVSDASGYPILGREASNKVLALHHRLITCFIDSCILTAGSRWGEKTSQNMFLKGLSGLISIYRRYRERLLQSPSDHSKKVGKSNQLLILITHLQLVQQSIKLGYTQLTPAQCHIILAFISAFIVSQAISLLRVPRTPKLHNTVGLGNSINCRLVHFLSLSLPSCVPSPNSTDLSNVLIT